MRRPSWRPSSASEPSEAASIAKLQLDRHIDNSPLAVIEFDDEFRITRWSDEAERMFGWPASEVLGKAIGEFKWVYEEDQGLVDTESRNLLTAATPRSLNMNRNYRKDGSVIWCEWYDSAVYDDEGNLISILSQVLDITERKRSEVALRESEAKYRNLFTNLIDGFALHEIVLDKKGRPVDYVFLEVNKAFEVLTGLKAKDILGRRATEVLPGIADDPADWIGRYGRVALTGEPHRFEQHSEQLGRWYAVSAYRPEPGRFVTVFDDITSRREAELALAESRARADQLAAMLDSSSQPFAISGFDGDLSLANRAYEELVGYTSEELRAANWARDLTPPEYSEFESRRMAQLRRTHKPVRYEKELVRKDGTRVPVELLVGLVRDESGAPQQYYAFVTDLTERKRAEDRVRESHEMIERERTRLRTIIDEIPIGITLLDGDGTVLEVNDANRRIWAERPATPGHRAAPREYQAFERDTGKPFEGRDDWPAFRALDSGEAASTTADIRRFDGKTASVRFTAVPIRTRPGEPAGVVSITEDITDEVERQRIEEALSSIRTAVSATLDIDEIIRELSMRATGVLGVEKKLIAMRKSDRWVVTEVQGMPVRKGHVFTDDELPIAAAAVSQGRPVSRTDRGQRDTKGGLTVMRAFGARSGARHPIARPRPAARHSRVRAVARDAAVLGPRGVLRNPAREHRHARPRQRARATNGSGRSPTRCRRRCSRHPATWPASRRPSFTGPRRPRRRSGLTSTTSSNSITARSASSSATCRARASTPRVSRRSCATASAPTRWRTTTRPR